MDFRLRAFLAVAKNLSFTKAAKELNVSQPAVSKHIQELENTYKVKLFSRQGGRMELTTEGLALERYAQQIISAYDKMNIEMELLRKPVYGELRIGTDTAAAHLLYKETVPLFEKQFHNVRLSVYVAQRVDLEKRLENGELDIVLVSDNGSDSGLTLFPDGGLSPQSEAFLNFVELYK